jgi:LmbE family N-acetylglucosaminyl deacetylase
MGAEVAYLSLSRGEGGQNLLGPHLGVPLGLVRTQELLGARRVDGGRQYFTRAYDFGYTRSLDETLSLWPKAVLLEDATRIVRRFRPQVVVTVFSGTARDGHGHHQASAVVGREVAEADLRGRSRRSTAATTRVRRSRRSCCRPAASIR